MTEAATHIFIKCKSTSSRPASYPLAPTATPQISQPYSTAETCCRPSSTLIRFHHCILHRFAREPAPSPSPSPSPQPDQLPLALPRGADTIKAPDKMSSDTDASETGGSSGLVNATSHTGFDWPNNTAVVPMTTPFAMPSGCLDYNGGTVSIDSSQLYSVSNNTFAVGTTLRMNEDVLQRPSCLPSGIQNATYFPAVCPSGWTYYSMVPPDSYTWLTTNSTLGYPAMMTTAYCCPR